MRYTLEIRPAARQEFDEASDWYNDEAPHVRDRFVGAVDKTIAAVTQRPLTFPVIYCTKARRAIVEKFPYSIIFIIDGAQVIIVSIFHDNRNPMIWRRRVG